MAVGRQKSRCDKGAADDKQDRREEAARLAEQARSELEDDNYPKAARLFEEAASVLPVEDRLTHWFHLLEAAEAWYSQGNEFGDNEALLKSIDSYKKFLALFPRAFDPLYWARNQMSLGNALLALGRRESGTERLEEAVAAYRLALEERTWKRVPLDWAAAQHDLGLALQTLGEREQSIDLIQQALTAYRNAREVYAKGPGRGHYKKHFVDAKIAKLEAIIARGFPDG